MIDSTTDRWDTGRSPSATKLLGCTGLESARLILVQGRTLGHVDDSLRSPSRSARPSDCSTSTPDSLDRAMTSCPAVCAALTSAEPTRSVAPTIAIRIICSFQLGL